MQGLEALLTFQPMVISGRHLQASGVSLL